MKRIVLTLVAGAVLATPFAAGSAHAATPQNKVHKLCVEFPTGNPGTAPGYCITQELPI